MAPTSKYIGVVDYVKMQLTPWQLQLVHILKFYKKTISRSQHTHKLTMKITHPIAYRLSTH